MKNQETTLKGLAETLPRMGLRTARQIERAYAVLEPRGRALRMLRAHIQQLRARP